jgi:Dolichyl-phosphate-mannose-protein mannosyltransferase
VWGSGVPEHPSDAPMELADRVGAAAVVSCVPPSRSVAGTVRRRNRRLPSRSLSSVRPVVVALALAILAFLTGTLRIGTTGFWRDEAFSAQLASLPAHVFFPYLATHEPNGAFYHLLMYGWVRLDDGEAFLRIPSLAFAAGTVAATYLLGRRLVGHRVALVAALLLLSNPLFISLATDERSYSLLMLTSTCSSLVFVRAVVDHDRASWRIFPFIAALSLYCHYFAALTLLGQFASLGLVDRRSGTWRRAATSAAYIAVLTMPLIAFVKESARSLAATWIPSTTIHAIGSLIVILLGGVATSLLLIALSTTALSLRILRSPRSIFELAEWPLAFLSCTAVLPVAIGILASLAKPLLLARYFAASLPVLLLLLTGLIVRGFETLRSGATKAAVGAIAVLVSLHAGYAKLVAIDKPDSRGAVEYVLANAKAHDAIAFPSFWGIPAFQWYGSRKDPAKVRMLDFVLPAVDSDVLMGHELWKSDFLIRSTPKPSDRESAGRVIRGNSAVWAIYDGGGDTRSLFEERVFNDMLLGRKTCKEARFRGVIVRVFADDCP